MATLLELKTLFTNSDLHDKVQAALIKSVQATLATTPTTEQQKYAAHVFNNPSSEAAKALMSVLAENSGADEAQITGAADAAIQANVDSIVGTLSVAYNAGLI